MATLFIPPPRYSHIKPKVLIIQHTNDKAYRLAIIDIPVRTNNSQFDTNINIAPIEEKKFKIIFFSRVGDELVCLFFYFANFVVHNIWKFKLF